MDKRSVDEKLNAPSDFLASAVTRVTEGDLMTPSHFTALPPIVPPSGRGLGRQWVNHPTVPSMSHTDPWITQAQREIAELRLQNQRLLEARGALENSQSPGLVEVERLRGQLEAVKETSLRQREEIRERESALNRQSFELQESRSDLCKVRAELNHGRSEQEKLCVQLGKLRKEHEEECERLQQEMERSRRDTLRLQEEQRSQQEEVLELREKAHAEVCALRQTCAELQEKLSHSTQESAQMHQRLREACEEKERLRQELSRLGSAFESQSATLQSLRTYIGQLVPESSQQVSAVQKLEKEKEALQVSVELLTVRLNSLKDIVSIQEQEMEDKTASHPLLSRGCKGQRVLSRWREKVFTLLVQLRCKDMELGRERAELLATISTLEQQGKQQSHQNHVLQHSLQDKSAELQLEKVGRKTVETQLTEAQEANQKLKAREQESQSVLRSITQSVTRFTEALEAKMGEMGAAQSHLVTLGQRLTFAKHRTQTIQALMMRKEALRKVQQAAKPSERAPQDDLRSQLELLEEERQRLAEELKRTPLLIEGALSQARERSECDLRQVMQEMESSRREGLETQQRLKEREEELERLREEVTHLQEKSGREVKQKLWEAEAAHTQQVREMEAQLNAARREHTKAVVTLRQSQRQAERERKREKEILAVQEEQTRKELQDLQKLLQAADRDRNLLLATVREHGLLKEFKKARSSALKCSAALQEPLLGVTSDQSLLCALDDLRALSAAVMNSPHNSSEEGDGDCAGADGHLQQL